MKKTSHCNQGWVKLFFFRELTFCFFFLKKNMVFSEKCFFPIFTDHITYSVVYTKNTAFGPFRRPDGISESRNSSPSPRSVAPIWLNLVLPEPDCPPYQQTKHIQSISDGILVQLQTNEKKHMFFLRVLIMFFFPLCLKRFFFQTCQP